MLKKAFLHLSLTLFYAVGSVFLIFGNIFIHLSEKILTYLDKK